MWKLFECFKSTFKRTFKSSRLQPKRIGRKFSDVRKNLPTHNNKKHDKLVTLAWKLVDASYGHHWTALLDGWHLTEVEVDNFGLLRGHHGCDA